MSLVVVSLWFRNYNLKDDRSGFNHELVAPYLFQHGDSRVMLLGNANTKQNYVLVRMLKLGARSF